MRYEWYDRWMHQPLRMAPGTRMPQAFVDGKSTLTTVLNGDPKGQAEAMWAYLSLGPGLPLPEGLEPPKGLIVAVKDRPEVLRTFMPDAGSKAIAVGYPGGVNVAFSADQCRLAYAWGGNFLDASPVWNNRGGAPAKLLGPKFWTGSDRPPVGPDREPAHPARLPRPGEQSRRSARRCRSNRPASTTGRWPCSFDGYSLDKSGRPTFRYSLDESGEGRGAEGVGNASADQDRGRDRLHAAVRARSAGRVTTRGSSRDKSTRTPRVLSASGARAPSLDLKAEEPLVPAAGVRVVLPQDGDKAIVLEALDARRTEPNGGSCRSPAAGGS